jgi:hypothetical protein
MLGEDAREEPREEAREEGQRGGPERRAREEAREEAGAESDRTANQRNVCRGQGQSPMDLVAVRSPWQSINRNSTACDQALAVGPERCEHARQRLRFSAEGL